MATNMYQSEIAAQARVKDLCRAGFRAHYVRQGVEYKVIIELTTD